MSGNSWPNFRAVVTVFTGAAGNHKQPEEEECKVQVTQRSQEGSLQHHSDGEPITQNSAEQDGNSHLSSLPAGPWISTDGWEKPKE